VPLRLRPLRADELPAFIEHARAAYVRDLVEQAGLTQAAATKKTADDWPRLFPDGKVAAGNELFAIEDGESAERVGGLWFAERDNDAGEKTLYVYSIEIDPEFRGRGFGREAMQLVEDEARSRGLSQTNLTVLGGNGVARSLYRSLGYVERAVFMSKDL
jgi:ribosomal protein S18 acetylase RimI-like enzyme